MKPFLQLKSVAEVKKLIQQAAPVGTEQIGLAAAPGRHISQDFVAPYDLPGFIRSRMDGYAVQASDVFGASESSPALLTVTGECAAGALPARKLGPGQAAAIVTGAPLPEGADAVVMVENTRKAGPDQIEIIKPVTPGANLVEADEDAKEGQTLIAAGSRLRAQECGILASFGIQSLAVFKKPRIAIIATGDEIVPIDSDPGPCCLRDVNSWSIAAFCDLRGATPLQMGIAADDATALAQKLEQGLACADAVVMSGGSSAGVRDLTAQAFLSLPDAALLAHGVAMRPGKPFILARSDAKYLLGLPGHVTSALICCHVFLGPLLSCLQGQPAEPPKPWLPAVMERSVASAQGRADYIRCRLKQKAGAFIAQPLRSPSAVLSNLLEADGIVICPENSEGLAKGQQVRFYPLG